MDESTGPAYWQMESGVDADGVDAWIVLANPLRLDAERWLSEWNLAFPGVPSLGGLASGDQENIVICRDGRAISGDAVALGLSGGVQVRTIVSQGCRPIGEPLTITGARQNLLLSLGSKPAYSVLNTVFNGLTKQEKDRARNNLFAGLAMSEYVEDYKRGRFPHPQHPRRGPGGGRGGHRRAAAGRADAPIPAPRPRQRRRGFAGALS